MREKKEESSRSGWMLPVLIVVSLWSLLPVLSIYTNRLPAFLRMAIALSFSSFVYIAYWLYRYRGSVLQHVRPGVNYCLISVIGIFVANLTFLAALRGDPGPMPYMVMNIWPIVAQILSCALGYGSLKSKHYWGSALGIAGIMMIGYSAMGRDGYAGLPWINIAFAISNCIAWSLYSLSQQKFSQVRNDLIGIPLGLLCLISWVCHILFEQRIMANAEEMMALLVLGVGPWGLAYTLWRIALCKGDVKVVVNYAYLSPVLGIIWMVALGYAQLSITLVLALACVLMGSAIGSLKD